MLIPPNYVLTPKISQLFSSIEASKQVIDSVAIPVEVEKNIRRSSTLRSSLFSARIEGNTLTLDDLVHSPSRDQKKMEVINILKALNWISERKFKDFSTKDILELHQMVLANLTAKESLGRFRTQVGAIFNSAGIAIYLPPPPRQVPQLIERVVKFINGSKEQFVPIKASLTHFTFEKIHPFLDGNGRVGRLLLQAVLQKEGYGMKGLLAVEEYLDHHRAEYYRSLEATDKDLTDYLEFMLEAIAVAAEKAKQTVLEKQQTSVEEYLLPRRAEILNIIKDQRLVNFDQIRRRFLSVNERTLRYDLKKLQDQGLIRKRGSTKGVYYEFL